MDADSEAVLAGGDRLSRLGDGTLGHILSFLPAAEAARAAALSRRWRHVFAAVHTLNFRESERPLSMRGYQWFRLCDYCDPHMPDGVRPPRLVAGVGAALFLRHRGAAAPLRALRVAFDEFGYRGGADARNAIDGWLSYATYHAADELEIDLRLDAGSEPACTLLPPGLDDAEDGGDEQEQDQEFVPHDVMDTDPDLDLDGGGDQTMPDTELPDAAGEPYPRSTEYITPKSLFSCAALRTLRLGRCRLDLPSAIAMPSLDKLHLTRVTGGGAVQRLVSACPRLADLTLEACYDLTELSIHGGARLRRLALRCCHQLAAVAVGDSSELRSFEYRGAVPEGPNFLTMGGSRRKISLCTVDLCGEEPDGTPELGNLMNFLRLFAGIDRLYLTSDRLGLGVGRRAFSSSALAFPAFPALRNLELTGMLPGDDISSITAVTRMLERTPSLETLSLFFLPEPHPVAADSYANNDVDEEAIHAAHKLRFDRHAALAVPGVDIPCLSQRVREINLVHYQGAMAQRMLAKFLLRNAPVVDEVWCEFARGPLSIQTELMGEIKGWVLNKSANVVFR